MGALYGSIQVRSQDRERVKAAAEQVARAKNIHCLVSPANNGWVAVFPENHGQDNSVGREIAKILNEEDVLHLMVHDDDVFAYWLYRKGELVDSYWSSPGYFGEENCAAEEKMAGNPEAFRPLIADRVEELPALLARDVSPVFASETLQEFAKVLRIPAAVNAYEYLKAGEWQGIKGWRQFQEVPAEQARARSDEKRRARELVKSERKRLAAAGLLLVNDEHQAEMARGCTWREGFLVAWPDYRGTVSFNSYEEPWTAPSPIPLQTPAHITELASDAKGKRVVMSAGDRVSIWDAPESGRDGWRHVADVPEGDVAIGVAISADAETVAHASRQEIVVTEIHSGRKLLAIPAQGRQHLAFDPSGEWLAATGNTLALISLRQGPHLRELYVGGKSNLGPAFGELLRSKMREVDLDALDQQRRAMMDKTVQMLQTHLKKKLISQEQLDEMCRRMEKSFEETKSRMIALKEGRLPPAPAQGNEHVSCVGFSRDGRWLWCGTSVGLRVYEWSGVPRESGADVPRPRFSFDLPGTPQFDQFNHVNAVAEEIDAPAIVFGGGTGRLYRLDLTTGEARELVKLPDQVAIYALSMSLDGQTLGVAAHRVPTALRALGLKDQRCTWSVWSYPKLRGAFMRAEPQ